MQKSKLYNRKIDFIDKDDVLKKLSESFPEYPISELKEIVDAPFLSMKEDLKNDKLFIYRFENFGTFYCNIGRAKFYINSIKNNVSRGSITEERGNEIISMLEDFIKRKS